MSAKFLSDEAVHSNLLNFRVEENNLDTKVIDHLREVDRRRLYSAHGYSSLWDYATKCLKYTEDQAARRINAMRMVKELPSIEPKIASGELSLTNVSKAYALFRKEKKANINRPSAQKLEVITKLENVSKREAEKTLDEVSLLPTLEAEKPIVEIESFDPALQAKLRRLMDVKALTNVNELIDLLAELGLEKWDPVKKAERAQARIEKAAQSTKKNESKSDSENDAGLLCPGTVTVHEYRREYVRATIRHALNLRDKGACVNCGTTRYLEIDHIIPVALGGKTELSNLRTLCRSCNQRAAIEKLGQRKMDRHLRSPMAIYH